eukprot:965743-Pelagomonas_calceolata.AAC.2
MTVAIEPSAPPEKVCILWAGVFSCEWIFVWGHEPKTAVVEWVCMRGHMRQQQLQKSTSNCYGGKAHAGNSRLAHGGTCWCMVTMYGACWQQQVGTWWYMLVHAGNVWCMLATAVVMEVWHTLVVTRAPHTLV